MAQDLMEQFNADAYTLKAQVRLTRIEENKQLQQAIKEGNQEIFDEIMENAVDNRLTWGDHIKRYIFDCISDGTMKIEDITRKQMEDFIKKAFADNGMRDRGSIDPEANTPLSAQLKNLDKPVMKIKRKTCFLFCFGLNMDEDAASYMLEVLRQANFNPRNYKEAIYYYCLCNNLQYAGVVEWLGKYNNLPENDPFMNDQNSSDSLVLENRLKIIAKNATEKDFLEYLAMLKQLPDKDKKSKTRANVLARYCREFYQYQSEYCEKVDDDLLEAEDSVVAFMKEEEVTKAEAIEASDNKKKSFGRKKRSKKEQLKHRFAVINRALFLEDDFSLANFEKCLKTLPAETVTVSPVLKQMVREDLMVLPRFTEDALKHKIGSERSTEITREDILTIIFLVCSSIMGEDFAEEGGYDYRQRKAEFVCEANLALEKCGFGNVYLLNPFELFLVSCLLQPRPMEYFLSVWRQLM